MVRHVAEDGTVRPAVIVATDGIRADLAVLQTTHRGVLLSPRAEGNTFHFPERIAETPASTPAEISPKQAAITTPPIGDKPLPIVKKGGKKK